MTTSEVAKEAATATITACAWARKNGVELKPGSNGRPAYAWSKRDLARFINRNKSLGRPSEKTSAGKTAAAGKAPAGKAAATGKVPAGKAAAAEKVPARKAAAADKAPAGKVAVADKAPAGKTAGRKR